MNLGPNGQSTSKRLAKAGLLVAAVAVLSGVCAGASWASGYDPSTDPNSISSTAAYTGAKQWWSAGYTGKGIDVAVIDSGVAPVQGLGAPDKVRQRPRPLARVAGSEPAATSTPTATARSWPA